MLGLDLAELERLGHERLLAAGRSSLARMVAMICVDDVDGLEQALDDVRPLPGLGEPELGTPPDDLDLVLDVGLQRLRRG